MITMIAEAMPYYDGQPGAICPHCGGWVYERWDGLHCDGCGRHANLFNMEGPLTAERIARVVQSPLWGMPYPPGKSPWG